MVLCLPQYLGYEDTAMKRWPALILILALCFGPAKANSFLGHHGGTPSFTPVVGDEFVGPFANWINATTGKRMDGTGSTVCTGATGNGSTDDAAALTSCTGAVGPTPPALWLPSPAASP